MSNEEIVKEIKQGINTTENLEKLYLNNKGYIYKIANKYKGYADIDDLIQEGYLGLYNAIEPYDETQGNLFMTYAGFHIENAMTRHIEKSGKVVRMPGYLLARIRKYRKVISAFNSLLNRLPTDEELCKALIIDFKALETLKIAIHHFDQLGSLESPIAGAEDDSRTVKDLIPDKTNTEDMVIDSMMDNSIKTELWHIVERETNEIENKVINARYKRALTLNSAGREIGITKEAVRQWEGKALRKLRRARVTREIKEKFEINYARSYRGSITSFRNDWSSIVENIALKNIEIERMT